MTRMAGDAFEASKAPSTNFSFKGDGDLVEMDDGVKVPKDDVKEYVKNNYKKNKNNSGFGGLV